MKLAKFLLIFLIIINTTLKAAPTEIIFWHSFAGKLGDEFKKLVDDFNIEQNAYKVVPVYKGDYIESLTSFAASFRANKKPHIIQVFEVGAEVMLYPEGIIEPVAKLMDDFAFDVESQSLFPGILKYYEKEGMLMALPFNTSVPVIYFDKAALKKVGISENNFPKTWQDLEKTSRDLLKKGYKCAYTSAYPAWILLESYSSIHGLALFDANGGSALYNNKQIVNHLQKLQRWQKERLFEYGGRMDDATILFTSERCPMFSQSSGSYAALSEMVNFDVGVAPMPIEENNFNNRFRNVVGGGAIWVVAGLSDEQREGIANFFSYILKPKIQEKWHARTGFLPVGINGKYENIAQNSKLASLVIAKIDLLESKPNINNNKMHNQIRIINDEAIEAIFAGMKTPKEAMDNATIRANHALKRFQKNTKQATVTKQAF